MRERWGTFSVRDHLSEAAFVSDVLLYDRLIIPVPAPAQPPAEAAFWQQWDPEKLEACLKILKIKTDAADGLALTIPWDADKRARFTNRMSAAVAVDTQKRQPDQLYYVDPFEMTKQLIKDEFLPALPKGVSHAWTAAAYTSTDKFQHDLPVAGPGHYRPRLATLIRHRFLTPAKSDPKHEMLKRAVDLATTDDFRQKRARFYEWQEEVLELDIPTKKAIEELQIHLCQYNVATEKAFKDVTWKYVFTVIPVGLAMAGAVAAGGALPMVLAAAAGLVQLTRFWRFDRKPSVAAGDFDAAAMVHDASAVLPLAQWQTAAA